MSEQLELNLPEIVPEPGATAVARYYQDIGRRVDVGRTVMQARREDGLFIYNLQAKWPKPGKHDTLVMVKAFHHELGPVIAFSNGSGWMGALLSFTGRLQAGQVDWITDEYPPDDWAEWMAFLHQNTYNEKGRP